MATYRVRELRIIVLIARIVSSLLSSRTFSDASHGFDLQLHAPGRQFPPAPTKKLKNKMRTGTENAILRPCLELT